MRRGVTLAGVILIATALPREVRAEWAALSWDACGAEVLAKQFACDTNVGVHGRPENQCRAGAITGSISHQPEDGGCIDVWFGQLVINLVSVTAVPGVPRVGLRFIGADLTGTISMQPFVETFVVAVNISYEKSIGAASCAGCVSDACVQLRDVTSAGPGAAQVSMPLLPGHDLIAWQTTPIDCVTTPVRNRTWGAIKALYR